VADEGASSLRGTRARLAIAIIGSALLAVLATLPVQADTSSDLNAEKHKLAALQSDLDRLAQDYATAQAKLAGTEQRIQDTKAQVARLRTRMSQIQAQLAERAKIAYETGGGGTLEMLLSSDSFGQFSDRVEFLGRLAQDDTDLLLKAQVTGEELRRYQNELSQLSNEQSATVRSLHSQQAAIEAKLSEAQSTIVDLQKKLERERAAERARAVVGGLGSPPGAGSGPSTTPVFTGGALQACPVGQPRTFVDTFGAPRPGGRTHQGIDIMAPYGTPVYAAQSGTFKQNYNSLGGISALVYAASGDYTYYAHMDSYGASGHVSAGTQIGTVGNTGNAAGGPTHLHFEYHPGGGSAVDPTPYLDAVC